MRFINYVLDMLCIEKTIGIAKNYGVKYII